MRLRVCWRRGVVFGFYSVSVGDCFENPGVYCGWLAELPPKVLPLCVSAMLEVPSMAGDLAAAVLFSGKRSVARCAIAGLVLELALQSQVNGAGGAWGSSSLLILLLCTTLSRL